MVSRTKCWHFGEAFLAGGAPGTCTLLVSPTSGQVVPLAPLIWLTSAGYCGQFERPLEQIFPKVRSELHYCLELPSGGAVIVLHRGQSPTPISQHSLLIHLHLGEDYSNTPIASVSFQEEFTIVEMVGKYGC